RYSSRSTKLRWSADSRCRSAGTAHPWWPASKAPSPGRPEGRGRCAVALRASPRAAFRVCALDLARPSPAGQTARALERSPFMSTLDNSSEIVAAHRARTRDQLAAAFHRGDQAEWLMFWGHRPEPGGRITISCLSQWYPAAFTVDSIEYPSAEHFMMAAKARLFA